MITPEYCRTMARYGAWQNRSLYGAAEALTDAQRREDRGAFFRSVQGTLGHLLWADTIWMSRFNGGDRPTGGPADGETWDWDALRAARSGADARIADWTAGLSDADLAGDLTWFSAIAKADMTRPKWIAVAHFFNHQTHHRGQVHALLTGFGLTTDITDLGFMPDDL